MLHGIIMAGGSGTRFWPRSRRNYPKQFLKLTGDRTLIQQTFDRCRPLIPTERMWVVTNQRLAEKTKEQLPELPERNLLLEPQGRNTAPCVGLAAIHILKQDPDATMLIVSADQSIQPDEKFREVAEKAASVVEESPERLVLFGIPPSYPATGFGYICRGAPLSGHPGAYEVKRFQEKPNRWKARWYLWTGRYYWNSGIFVWKAKTILEQIQKYEPDIYERLCRLQDVLGTDQWQSTLEQEFPQMKSISIDYAVLERVCVGGSATGSPNNGTGSGCRVCVFEAPFQWDDVGSWQALARLAGSDEHGNTVVGLHCGVDIQNCIICTEGDHLIGTVGVKDCVIVHTKDATLVARRDDENALRKLVAELEKRGYDKYL